ncbi:hypothetical protein D9613_012094 [Agrocybe pediades]|uniref:Uncharacterized protein n=1 Tax=Agrocybe pediades TaxID=84607 RepID=A0A8H4R327_9AGAR|nr:hypothetical protein D9613_012094 [Agrocybe pediades]
MSTTFANGCDGLTVRPTLISSNHQTVTFFYCSGIAHNEAAVRTSDYYLEDMTPRDKTSEAVTLQDVKAWISGY